MLVGLTDDGVGLAMLCWRKLDSFILH